jgi:hypothetical protein
MDRQLVESMEHNKLYLSRNIYLLLQCELIRTPTLLSYEIYYHPVSIHSRCSVQDFNYYLPLCLVNYFYPRCSLMCFLITNKISATSILFNDHTFQIFRFLESTSTLDQIGLPFSWTNPTAASGESSQIRITVPTESPETPPKAPSIRLSSESQSLNDIVYRPSRFQRFAASGRKRMRDVSGRIKNGLSTMEDFYTCRKQEKAHDIEMS